MKETVLPQGYIIVTALGINNTHLLSLVIFFQLNSNVLHQSHSFAYVLQHTQSKHKGNLEMKTTARRKHLLFNSN